MSVGCGFMGEWWMGFGGRGGALVGGEVGWEGMVCWGGEVQGLTLSSGRRVERFRKWLGI